ncbi:uncharacterized protein LOC105188463 isoform X1 [Harpegnathos saltator]|uniref:uncharacterized protein LOC105188463 isoform X1 n=1 Tax=Harpegnathos saltator TaxID=610380 RepID=UPI00058B4386|nr:uncharacterized protein LOC105188463 isoform X1 [Harpegnathos saltator]
MKVTCETDDNCPSWQYCYIFSNLCVNFTKCAAYNREEGANPVRSSSQCGPCLNGFQADIHRDGQQEVYCKTIPNPTIDPEPNLDLTIWYIVIPIFITILLLIITIFAYIYFKKRRICSINSLNERDCEIGEQKIMFHPENTFKPTAPPERLDQSVAEKKKYCSPFYHKGNAIVDDKSQNAVPWHEPSWVGNASFSSLDETNNNNDESSARRNRASRACRLPAENPDSNEQRVALIPEETVEHEDNARNIALMQINSPSSSNDNADNTNFTTFNDDRNENQNEDTNRIINKTVLIKQNITMNLNMTND